MSFTPRVTNGKGLIDPPPGCRDVRLTGGLRAGGLDAWMPRRGRIVPAKDGRGAAGQPPCASPRPNVPSRGSLLIVRILGEAQRPRDGRAHLRGGTRYRWRGGRAATGRSRRPGYQADQRPGQGRLVLHDRVDAGFARWDA